MNDLMEAVFVEAFGTGLSQHARLITLESAQGSELPESLMAERFTAREAVNELFVFDIEALSVSASLDLSVFIGEELTLTLLQPDDSRRAWHGICTAANLCGADGGVARYRLRLEPALRQLCHRRDSYIFQNKDVRAIVTELLSDYPLVRCDFDITESLAVRPICTQYVESDYDFLVRLLVSEGLSWRFEHAPAGGEERHARHKLVIFDSRAVAPPMPGGDVLRFHGVRAADTDDAIDQFGARREMQADAVTISSWDPALVGASAAEQRSALDAGAITGISVYDGSGERIATEDGAADAQASLMLKALEFNNKVFDGAGAVRRLAAGHAFTLTQHDRFARGECRYTVIAVEHEARNNFQPGMASASSSIERGTYRNRFTCVRDSVAIVPAGAALPCPPTAPGGQSAMVVGLPGGVVTSTRDHEVKVQFAWQRGERPNSGGTAHNTDSKGNAPGDDGSGTWVRVSEALAGPNWGSVFTPRIGTEVLVDFVEGDIDRPVIVGQLYAGADAPPFPGGFDSGANHAGTLSGIHSRTLDGGGFNQWQLDDTAEQLRMRLATSCASTQLNLGYLIEQSPTSTRRGAHRGSGFELRTDAWAAMRGGEGVLLTTHARRARGAGVASTQLDAAEALAGLKAGRQLAKVMGDAARQQNALASKAALEALGDLIALVDPDEKGKHPGTVNGQAALKASAGSRELDTDAAVERFGSPVVLVDSAASINWATPASTVVYAGQNLQWTAHADLHFAAGKTYSSVSGKATTFFTHDGGIQAIAANGPVSLQAHTDQLEILADKEITVISVSESIEIKAKDKIVLQAGQSAITLESGDITFACSGDFTVKGGKHALDKGAQQAADLSKLPDSRPKLFDEAFILKDKDTGEPFAHYPYRIKRADGSYEEGVTDALGQTHVVLAPEEEEIEVELKSVTLAPPAFDEQIQFKNVNGASLANVAYQLRLEDGSTVNGVTDSSGMTTRIASDAPLKIEEATLQSAGGSSCCSGTQVVADYLKVRVAGVATNPTNVGTSVAAVVTPEGESRGLTAGEIRMVERLFKNSVDYSKVKIHKGEFLWFGLQPDNAAMAPNGEIYLNPDRFVEDYTSAEFDDIRLFIHEMVHVWQYQLGYPVMLRGAFRVGLSYKYTLAEDKLLSDYNMEAQGHIISDYWTITMSGKYTPDIFEDKHVGDLYLYKQVLRKFLADPSDKTNLP